MLGSAVGNISYQASQIVGFVVGAAVVSLLDPYRTLGLDAVTFGLSALIVLAGVKPRPAPRREGRARPSLWSVSADGARTVFSNRILRTLLLFGWLAGFYIVPEGLPAPYARSQHGNTLTVGLLMAAMPVGMVIGAFLLDRVAAPSARIRMMGWLAVLSCAPLIGSAWSPPLWAVLLLWTLAGAGGAYQLAAAAAFVQALTPSTRGSAFGLVQSGLYAVQGLGHPRRRRGGPGRWCPAGRWAGGTGRPDRGHHARDELDPPARPADPGAPGRGGWSLGAPFVNEGLGDRDALALLGHHDPCAQVQQDPSPAEDSEQGERETHQGRIDPEIGRQARADPSDNAPVSTPAEALGSMAAWFVHSSIMPASGARRQSYLTG